MAKKFAEPETEEVNIVATIPRDLMDELIICYDKMKEKGEFEGNLSQFYGQFIIEQYLTGERCKFKDRE